MKPKKSSRLIAGFAGNFANPRPKKQFTSLFTCCVFCNNSICIVKITHNTTTAARITGRQHL